MYIELCYALLYTNIKRTRMYMANRRGHFGILHLCLHQSSCMSLNMYIILQIHEYEFILKRVLLKGKEIVILISFRFFFCFDKCNFEYCRLKKDCVE